MSDPTLDEMRKFCHQITPYKDQDYTFEFDREEAIYWFCVNCHGGQSSNLYAALCLSHFEPSPLSDGPEEWLARDLYDSLVKEFVL